MATATSSRRFLLGLALTALTALALTACGGASHHQSRAAGPSGAFSWLRPAASPAGWTIARLPSGKAALAYPPGWRAIKTDPGTVSAAIPGRGRPHPGLPQRHAGIWSRDPRQLGDSRPAHNQDEGDSAVRTLASARGLRFSAGSGSCVIDAYRTVSDRYREIACLVKGARATTVVVGAAEPAAWPVLAPQLERAIASFST